MWQVHKHDEEHINNLDKETHIHPKYTTQAQWGKQQRSPLTLVSISGDVDGDASVQFLNALPVQLDGEVLPAWNDGERSHVTSLKSYAPAFHQRAVGSDE